MTQRDYDILQTAFSKKLITNFPTNKESAFNNGVLACKSILKEIYNDSNNAKRSLAEYAILTTRFGICSASAKSKVRQPKYADSYKEGVQACSTIIEGFYLP